MAQMTEAQIDDIEDEKVFTLRHPIAIGDVEYKEIKLREPTGEELEAIGKKDGLASSFFAISLIGGVPEGVARKLGARDLNKMGKYLVSFGGGDQTTGS